MGLISLGLDEARRTEPRSITYQQFKDLGLVAPPTAAGPTVTQMTAFEVSAWWCGINVIAGDIGVLDFDLYRRVGEDDDREKVKNHPLAKVLQQPNEYMVPKVFWQTLMGHALGWGNAYAEIEWDQAMRPIALWPIMPNEIQPVITIVVDAQGRRRSKLAYRYRGQDVLDAEDILHIPGLGFDGICGYSVVSLARQSLGLSLAAERFEGSFFGNGTWTGLVLEHPRSLTKDAADRIRSSVQEMHKGAEAAFKLFVAEEGMKVGRPVTTAPKDAQASEIREGQISEVARWLNLPPHKLKYKMGERPGGNLESSETDYHTTTLLPWTTLLAQICNRKLISDAQRASYYTEHTYARRLQPTPKERMEIQKGYVDMGVMDAEQVARQENLPKPKPKPAPATPPVAAPPPPPPAPAKEPAAEEIPARSVRVTTAQRALLTAIVTRYIRRESENAKRSAKKGPAAFQEWVEAFYSGAEGAVLRESLEPAVALCMATTGMEAAAPMVVDVFAARHQERSKTELLAVRAKDLEAAVPAVLKRWETARAVEIVEELMAAIDAAEEREHVA